VSLFSMDLIKKQVDILCKDSLNIMMFKNFSTDFFILEKEHFMNAENANNPESEKSQDSDSWFNYIK
jgi:hypothetical protein